MKKTELMQTVKNLLLSNYHASLCSQISEDDKRDLTGFPYASLVRYSLNEQGQPVLLLSRIAEHTHYIQANNKVALLVQQEASDVDGNVQEAARISLIGELKLADKEQAQGFSERYFRQFPDAQMYYEQLDFDFYYLEVKQTRYVGGFAKAHWLEGQSWLPVIGFAEAETGTITHMNDDHSNAVQHYCELYDIENSEQDAVLTGLFVEGMHIKVGFKTHFAAFNEPVETREAMHQILIKLARASSL